MIVFFFLLTRYQSKISGIGVTPPTSSTVYWHTQSQRRHSSKFTMAFKVGLYLCLLSPSGLTPWRIPAGDVDAGQLPGRGNLGADSPLVAQHCRDVDLRYAARLVTRG